MCNIFFILAFILDCMNIRSIFCTTFIIAIGVCFANPEIAVSYGLVIRTMEMTQQPKSKNTIPILLLSKLLRTRIMLIDTKLKSKVWISRKSMSCRRPTLLVELVLQKAQLIDSHLNTKTIYGYLYGNNSAEVNSFHTCAVRLNGTKVCENTII